MAERRRKNMTLVLSIVSTIMLVCMTILFILTGVGNGDQSVKKISITFATALSVILAAIWILYAY